MKDINTWISVSALIISLAAFIHTLTRGISESKLIAAQLRSDLLTRIVKLKLEYEQEINHFYYLLELAKRNDMPQVSDILKLIETYQEYVENTQEHYNSLFQDKSYSSKLLVDIGHHIDALRAKVEYETKDLQEQVNKVEKLIN